MRTDDKTTVSIALDAEPQRRLTAIAESQDCSVDRLMQRAIEGFIEQEEQADILRQETLARWKQVEDNKTISHERVTEWLNNWGTDHEKARPECQVI